MMWIITAYLHLQSEDLYFWLVIFLKYNFKVNLRNWSNYLVGSLLGNMCIHSLLRKVLSIHTFCAWEDKKKHNKSVTKAVFRRIQKLYLICTKTWAWWRSCGTKIMHALSFLMLLRHSWCWWNCLHCLFKFHKQPVKSTKVLFPHTLSNPVLIAFWSFSSCRSKITRVQSEGSQRAIVDGGSPINTESGEAKLSKKSPGSGVENRIWTLDSTIM